MGIKGGHDPPGKETSNRVKSRCFALGPAVTKTAFAKRETRFKMLVGDSGYILISSAHVFGDYFVRSFVLLQRLIFQKTVSTYQSVDYCSIADSSIAFETKWRLLLEASILPTCMPISISYTVICIGNVGKFLRSSKKKIKDHKVVKSKEHYL